MSGFEFRETMSGTFRLLGDDERERPMTFTIRARTLSMAAFLKKPSVDIEGEVDASGFADHRHLRGTLGMDILRTGELPYEFQFKGNDGQSYTFSGKKTISAADLVSSMTVLPGALYDQDGRQIGTALLRFDLLRDLVKFLLGFRLSR